MGVPVVLENGGSRTFNSMWRELREQLLPAYPAYGFQTPTTVNPVTRTLRGEVSTLLADIYIHVSKRADN